MMKDFFSLSFETDQPNASSYLAVTGIVLSTTALTIPTAQARIITPFEVVVYEGEPIDYSNRDDVIFIDNTSSRGSFSDVLLAQNYTNAYSNQSKTIVSHTSSSSKPQALRNIRPIQPKVISLAKKSIDPMTQIELSKPFEKSIENIETKDPELAAFYVDATEMLKNHSSKQATPSTSPTTLAIKQTPTKNLVQTKYKSQSNEVQLSLTTSKGKNSELEINKTLMINAEGKDPELVAFYMDVFSKHNNNLSNQSKSSKTVTVRKTSTKNVAQKNLKSNKVQLSLSTSKVKDPELVAFYKQVFDKDTKISSKASSAVAATKIKDPELVAFYEREFGKSTINPLMPMLTNNVSSKTKIIASAKPDQKQSINRITKKVAKKVANKVAKKIAKKVVKKIAKKVKGKSISSISTELAELQELIDDLTDRKII